MECLENKRIIITGCGYKPINHIFYSPTYDTANKTPTHNAITINGEEMKMNIGTAIAMVLAEAGATIHIVGHSEEKVRNIKNALSDITGNSKIEYSALDLFDESQIIDFAKGIKTDKILYWVQSLGLGAGNYILKDDNPYLYLNNVPTSLIEAESKITPATHSIMRALMPYFEKQSTSHGKDTRIAIISSMSAIRGYPMGAAHCSAKGAIDRYANSAMLDLYREGIYLTTIRPGAVDTGMYDNINVQRAILEIDKNYGWNWRRDQVNWNKGITLAPPISVGEAVKCVFTTPAHITSLNLVAKGQFPHEGS